MSSKDTIEKAFGNIPKEVTPSLEFEFLPTFRGIKYYWLRLVRRTIGR
jgi:hypothetical protein